jgi:hypothetical protein
MGSALKRSMHGPRGTGVGAAWDPQEQPGRLCPSKSLAGSVPACPWRAHAMRCAQDASCGKFIFFLLSQVRGHGPDTKS